MVCVICKGKFYHQTWMEPAEPCDCGQNITAEDARYMDEVELGEARDHWKKLQEEESSTEGETDA